jgi:ribosome-binding protein aMBF1 (putative translation factor)
LHYAFIRKHYIGSRHEQVPSAQEIGQHMNTRKVIRVFSMEDISVLIKEHRKKVGLTQSELAARTNTSRSLIHDLERGKQSVQADKLLAVLAHLGVKIDLSYFDFPEGEIRG